MNNVYFKIYRDDIIKLVRSVVVKFEPSAIQMNHWLRVDLDFYTDESRPETWKYYMHLAGEYHATDKMMYVRSADTLETIEFTKENLVYHRATAREYYPGSQLYESLVRQFPEQSTLINGILHPVDKQKAIDARDGELLYYAPQYVESHEDYFIPALQDWINVFLLKWYNPNFSLTDDLYIPAVWGNLFREMVPAILNIRLRKAKTNKTYSYHIREYLASHNHLDDYLPYLDIRQRLWLYRNINFIMRNAGKTDTFNRLVNNLLTPRGIPLIRYTLKQNSKNMLNDHSPTVELRKHDINKITVVEGLDKITVAELLDREEGLARDNSKVKYTSEEWITEKMSSDKFSSLPTRVLDSEVIDRSNSSVRSLMSVLLNEWLHLASSNKYRAYVTLINPRNGEALVVSVKDAFIIMLYCWMKSRDYLSEFIPKAVAYEVLLDKLPTFNELRNMSPKRIIPDKIITAIQDIVEPMTSYISTEQFYWDCSRTHTNYLKQWDLYSFQEHPVGRGYCEQIVKMHYMHRMCSLVEGNVTWDQWFTKIGFSLSDLDNTELEQLCLDAINIATGSNLVQVITLGEIQRELLSLMDRLSSYPLQFLRNVSYTNFHVLGMVMPRVGDISADASGNIIAPVVNINVASYRTLGNTNIRISDAVVGPLVNYTYDQYGRYCIDPCVDIWETSFKESHYIIPACNIGVTNYVGINDFTPDANGNLDQYDSTDESNWPTFKE